MHRKGNGHHEGQGNGKTGKDAARIRRPFLADLDAVMGLIRVCDLVAHGGPDLSEEELRTDWASMDLGRDAWLALGPSGEALCYVAVSEGGTGRIDVELYALPGHAGGNIGAHLLRLAEDRAREMVVATPLGPSQHPPVPSSVVLQSTVGGADGAARKLLESVGYAFARGFYLMERKLGEELPEPVFPDDVEIRTLPAVPVERAVFGAIDEAFRDHWGHSPGALEAWAQRREAEDAGSGVWLAATAVVPSAEGREVVGAVFCGQRSDGGWIEWLAVRRSWRRRGLGSALLLGAFRELSDRGERGVSLVVDSESPTGAPGLYERAGMKVARHYAVYRKELRPEAPSAEVAASNPAAGEPPSEDSPPQ